VGVYIASGRATGGGCGQWWSEREELANGGELVDAGAVREGDVVGRMSAEGGVGTGEEKGSSGQRVQCACAMVLGVLGLSSPSLVGQSKGLWPGSFWDGEMGPGRELEWLLVVLQEVH
jgi:hypothetical protein